MRALYHAEDDDAFMATELTRGPWSAEAQHGSAPAALFVRQFERLDAPVTMQLARVTVELLRPIPVGRLRAPARVVRSGKRVQYAEAALLDGEREVARASAWYTTVVEAAIGTPDPPPPLPDADVEHTPPPWFEPAGFHVTAVSIRFVDGSFTEPGPATAWIELLVDVVAGEPASSWAAAMAASDFGNGISALADPRDYTFINTDLSVHLARPPADGRIALEGETIDGQHGAAVARSKLYDRRGAIGHAAQTLMVSRRR